MKVLISSHDSVAPLQGGGAVRTLMIAREFKKRGSDVILIAPGEAMKEIDGIQVQWLHPPRKQRSRILSSIKFNIRLMRKFLWFIEDADMLFIHNAVAAIFVPLLRMLFSFKFILDITDIHAEYIPVEGGGILERFLRPYLLKYEYWLIGSADALIVATFAMKRLLIEHGVSEDKIKVVYDGADISNFSRDKEPGSESTVIHLGAIDYQHGVDLLVRAIPAIIKKNREVNFLFIGGGEKLDFIKTIAKSLGVYNKCFFSGFIEHSKVKEYLKKAVVGVITRNNILPNRIITTLKLYEYWASATSVVAASLEGLREVAEDRKEILFFKPEDIADLASKINILLAEDDIRDRVIQGGLIKVEKFKWEDIASNIVDFSLTYYSP
jgi:glycosyltransferase involved in cell wall biosynthesis